MLLNLIALRPSGDRPRTGHPESQPLRPNGPFPVPRNPVYRSIDIWRGLICLLIVARHTAFLELTNLNALNWREHPFAMFSLTPVFLSWLRVPLFFVISGYCLSALCDKLRRSENPARTFARRRIRRIFIPYWIALVLLVPIAGALHLLGEGWWTRSPGIATDPRGLSVVAWLGNLSLVEHWRSHLAVGPLGTWAASLDTTPTLLWGHLWTLSFEVLLYVLCAILLVIRPRQVLAGMIGLGAVTVLSVLILGKTLLPLEWMEFSLGALLYCQLNYFRRPAATATTLLFAASAIAAILAELALGADQRIARTIAVSNGFALLLAALHRWDAVLVQSRWLQPFQRCGRISYSIYLIHMPISMTVAQCIPITPEYGFWPLLLVGMPLGVALSVAAGWAFYQIAEAPVARKPQPAADVPSRRLSWALPWHLGTRIRHS